MDRYYVDERIGCIAVRDRTQDDPDYPGLHADTQGVIKFWGGQLTTTRCPTCGSTSSEYVVPDEVVRAAYQLCYRLNHTFVGTLYYRDDNGVLYVLANFSVEAMNHTAARATVLDQFWDDRLDAASCTPSITWDNNAVPNY